MTDHKPKAPDGGYGWLMLAAGFCALFVHGAVIFSMTLMYQALLVKFNMNASETGSISAVFGTVVLTSSPIVSCLTKVLSLRVLVTCSGVLYSSGLLLAAFAVHPAMVIIGYGILAGFAGCIVCISFVILLTDYFEKKRSLAFAIFVSGKSFGGLVMPPLFSFWLSTYGFTGAVMLQAAIALNLVPIGMLVLPLGKASSAKVRVKGNMEIKSNHNNDEVNELETCIQDNRTHEVDSSWNKLNTESNIVDIKRSSISDRMIAFCKSVGLHQLKSSLFITYLMITSSLMYTYYITGIYMSGLAKERCDLTNAEVAMIIAIAAGVDLIAKVAIGFVLDIRVVRIRRPLFYITILISNSIVGLLIASVAKNFIGLCLMWVVFFSTISACDSQTAVLLADIISPKELSAAFGLSRFFQGAWVFIGNKIAGLLIDWFASYTYVFYFCAALNILTCVLFLIAYFTSNNVLKDKSENNVKNVLFIKSKQQKRHRAMEPCRTKQNGPSDKPLLAKLKSTQTIDD